MKFSQVRSYDNYIVANLQLNLLKVHGISCYLQDEHTITIDPLLSPAIGGMKLMVIEKEAAAAALLLDRLEEDYLKTLACPACKSVSLEKIVQVVPVNGFWQKFWSRFVRQPNATLKTHYLCQSCHKTFDTLPA